MKKTIQKVKNTKSKKYMISWKCEVHDLVVLETEVMNTGSEGGEGKHRNYRT